MEHENENIVAQILSENMWLMEPSKLESVLDSVSKFDLQKEVNPELINLFNSSDAANPTLFKIENGTAVIPVNGPIIKRGGLIAWILGISSYETIGKQFNAALADKKVKSILFSVDSPGGSVNGVETLSNLIFESRSLKPSMAFIDQGTSAAAWISTSCGYSVLSGETATTGSIGVVGCHLSYQDAIKKLGIKAHIFSSGKFKKIGHKFADLSASDKKEIQENFDYLHSIFLKAITRNTGIKEYKLSSDVREAKVFYGSQGVDAGLAHKIMDRKSAMAMLHNVANKNTSFAANKSKTRLSYNSGTTKNMSTNKEIKSQMEPKLEIKKFGLMKFVEELRKCETTDELSKLEIDIMAELNRRLDSADSHLDESRANALKKDITAICKNERSRLMAIPRQKKEMAERNLGAQVGRARFPHGSIGK